MPQFRRLSNVLADKTVNFAGLREAPRRGDSHFSHHLCGCAKVHTPSVLYIFTPKFKASFDALIARQPLNPSAQSLNPITMSRPAAAASSGLSCYKLKATLLLSRPRPNGGPVTWPISRRRAGGARASNGKRVLSLRFLCWTSKSRSWQTPRLVRNRIRGAAAALLFLVCLVTLTSAFNLPNRSPDLSSQLASLSRATKPAQQRTILTLADRVAYQRAIEEVYWRHRIWPKERPDPKPSLDEVMPPEQVENKVEDYLRNSQALEDYWQKPISAEQLQAEMERMAQHTKQPEVLRELFAALGNDPFVIAECLARPAVS